MAGVTWEAIEYIKIINKAGLTNVVRKIKEPKLHGHTKTNENIKRDIALMRDIATGAGYAGLITKYGVSRQRVHQIIKRYYNAAVEVLKQNE